MPTASFQVQYLWFILMNVLTFGSAFLTTARLYKYKFSSWSKFFLCTGTAFIFQILLTQILLGIFGLLTFKAVFTLNALIFVLCTYFFGKKSLRAEYPSKVQKIDVFAALAIFTPFIIIFVVRYFNALFQIPLEYDNAAYHLPFVVEWYKSGNILPVYYSAFASPLGYYPSNFELLDLWAMLPFGKDAVVNLLNLPVFPLLILAIYSVARNLKIPPVMSLLTAAFFLYMPQTFRQMGIPLVDVFFTLNFVTAIYFLQEYIKSKSYNDLIFFSVASGIFIGTKYLGLPFGFPLILLGVIAVIIHYFKDKIRILWGLIIIGAGSFLGGGFWYLRNLIESGNPIFPLQVNIFGKALFNGYQSLANKIAGTSLLDSVHNSTNLTKFIESFLKMVGGQTFLIIIGLIATVGILLYRTAEILLKKKKTSDAQGDIIVSTTLIVSSIFYFYFYWSAPFTFLDVVPNVRYSMMFLMVGCLMIGFIMSRIRQLTPVIYLLSFGIFSFNLIFLVFEKNADIITNDKLTFDYATMGQYWYYLPVFIIILLGISLSTWSIMAKKKYHFSFGIIIAVLTTGYVLNATLPIREELAIHSIDTWYEPEPKSHNRSIAGMAHWFDINSPLAKIAYTGFNMHYHFFGRNLQREVDYININECADCRHFEYRNSPESIRRNPDFNHWMSNLKKKGKEYIVIAPFVTQGVKMWEFEWAKEHPKNFQQVMKIDDIYTYKISY